MFTIILILFVLLVVSLLILAGLYGYHQGQTDYNNGFFEEAKEALHYGEKLQIIDFETGEKLYLIPAPFFTKKPLKCKK